VGGKTLDQFPTQNFAREKKRRNNNNKNTKGKSTNTKRVQRLQLYANMDTTTTNPKKTYHLSATVPLNASEKTSSCEWLRSGFVPFTFVMPCSSNLQHVS